MPTDLTDAEVAEEVGFIQREMSWLLWPILPVKHRARCTHGHPPDQDLGVMVAGHGPTVYLKHLGEFRTGSLNPQIDGVRTLSFDSYEALVRAGWMGD